MSLNLALKAVSLLITSCCLVAATLLSGSRAYASDWVITKYPSLSSRIDKLNEIYVGPHMPGAIVAVLKDGDVVHLKGYGFANREFDVPWDPTVLYTFFSVTKSMTASAMLLLQDRGKISLDDEIQKYLEDFPRFPDSITIRHLLTHTSGLHEDETLIHLVGTGAAYTPISLDELYELTKKQPRLSFKPGSYWYYCDTGLRVAARIIEKVTGKPFEEAMRELLFEPAGMKTASIKNYEPSYFPRQASSYALDTHPRPNPGRDAVDLLGIIVETSGDGAANGSMWDFIQYARFLSSNISPGRSLIERLAQPVFYRSGVHGAYRTCVVVEKHRGLEVIQHGGLYGKHFWFIPEIDAWVLVMRNAIDSEGPGWNEYGATIIDAILASDARYAKWLAKDNPDGEDRLGRPRPQFFEPDEIKMLVGTYFEPQSGHVIRITHDNAQLGFTYFGYFGALVREGRKTGSYRTDPAYDAPLLQIRVQNSGGLAMLWGDWPEARPLTRLSGSRPGPVGNLRDYAGLYRSEVYGAVYDISVAGSDQLTLKIGAGARRSDRFLLKHVTGDIFEGTQETDGSYRGIEVLVRFVRKGAKISGLELSTDDVRGLELERLKR